MQSIIPNIHICIGGQSLLVHTKCWIWAKFFAADQNTPASLIFSCYFFLCKTSFNLLCVWTDPFFEVIVIPDCAPLPLISSPELMPNWVAPSGVLVKSMLPNGRGILKDMAAIKVHR
jgi:hypothetical protein